MASLNDKDLTEVLAIVYDPIRGNMLTTRGLLHGMGLRRIEGVTSFAALERRIKDVEVSLLFLEASDEIVKISKLVKSIRLAETKANPFLPIIATLWSGATNSVAELMNCGCDDVLLRPFSVTKITERIQNLIESRKNFVVTSDYVGPDRGTPTNGHEKTDSFEVPNPLRDVAMGIKTDLVSHNEMIENAKNRMNKERLAKLARRIAMAAEVTIQARNNNSDESGFVIDLIETSSELVKTARRMGQDEIHDMAIVLENVVEKTAISSERAESAELARQLALAIYIAYAVDEGEEFKKELDKTLNLVRLRLDKATEREKRRRALAKSVDYSGFENSGKDKSKANDSFFEVSQQLYEEEKNHVSKYSLLK